MRQIPREKIQITVEPVEEWISPEESGKDAAPGFAEAVRKMQADHDDPWNWCTAKVTAKVPGLEACGVKYLGCCCYKDKQDFVENSGYYEDMVMEAIAELHDEVFKAVHSLKDLGLFEDHKVLCEELRSLADGQDDDLGRLLLRTTRALEFFFEEPVKA